MRLMGVPAYATHFYAVVDALDLCGVWQEPQMSTLLRALVDIGGYGGVLCVDLPVGCTDAEACVSENSSYERPTTRVYPQA
jgi:hypothetical protein